MRRKNLAKAWIDYDMVPKAGYFTVWKCMKYPPKSYSLSRNHANLENEIDSWQRKVIWDKDLKRHIHERCAITITICDSHDATQPHFLGNVLPDTNSVNCRKRSTILCTWTTSNVLSKNKKEVETLWENIVKI